MRRLACAVLVLSLEIVGQASASNMDAGVEREASLVSGVASPGQSGSGVAASTCLNGNSKQVSCGGSPTGIPYTTAQNWSQTSTTFLTACTTGISCSIQTLTLTPCPIGVDTATGMYDVYILDSNPEAVLVTGGTCTSGASSGTITFLSYFSHSSYTVESASAGIQETINTACGVNASHTQMGYCNITLPAVGIGYAYNRYQIFGTIFFTLTSYP